MKKVFVRKQFIDNNKMEYFKFRILTCWAEWGLALHWAWDIYPDIYFACIRTTEFWTLSVEQQPQAENWGALPTLLWKPLALYIPRNLLMVQWIITFLFARHSQLCILHGVFVSKTTTTTWECEPVNVIGGKLLH